MPVGDCQRAFGLAATGDGVAGLVAGPVRGLTDLGHLGLDPEAPTRQLLGEIFDRLGGDAYDLESGIHKPLPMDWVLPDHHLIIEVDESQHFTSHRLTTLDAYPADADVCFDIEEYKALCRVLRRGSDRYRAAKPARGFRRDGGRRAQRAYFDAVRDLAAPEFGWRVFRVAAGHGDGALAYRDARKALAELMR